MVFKARNISVTLIRGTDVRFLSKVVVGLLFLWQGLVFEGAS